MLNWILMARSENGYKVASYDRDLNGRTMNFNSAPGFALLGWYEKLSPRHPWAHAFPNNQTWPCWIPGLPYGSLWTWPPTPWECLDPTAAAGGCQREDQVFGVRSTYGAIYFLLGYVEVLKWYLGLSFAFGVLLAIFFHHYPNNWLTTIMGYWILETCLETKAGPGDLDLVGEPLHMGSWATTPITFGPPQTI